MYTDTQKITAPDRAREIAAKLAAYGIAVPAEAQQHLDLLDLLDGSRPPAPESLEVQDAYAEGRVADAERLALDVAAASIRAEAWRNARIKVGLRAINGYTANGEALTTELGKLAKPLIEKLHKAAEVETHDVAQLIRGGRTKDAELAARVDVYAGDLIALYDLRKRVTEGAPWAERGFDCSIWEDPRPAAEAIKRMTANLAAGPPAERWMCGIRAGARLWFPTFAEADAAAARVAAEARATAMAEQREQAQASRRPRLLRVP